MNGIDRLSLALPILLLGCADRSNELRHTSDESIVRSNSEAAGTVVSLDQLQGVHPHQPLILKTNAFDFQASGNGATIFCGDRQGVGV